MRLYARRTPKWSLSYRQIDLGPSLRKCMTFNLLCNQKVGALTRSCMTCILTSFGNSMRSSCEATVQDHLGCRAADPSYRTWDHTGSSSPVALQVPSPSFHVAVDASIGTVSPPTIVSVTTPSAIALPVVPPWLVADDDFNIVDATAPQPPPPVAVAAFCFSVVPLFPVNSRVTRCCSQILANSSRLFCNLYCVHVCVCVCVCACVCVGMTSSYPTSSQRGIVPDSSYRTRVRPGLCQLVRRTELGNQRVGHGV